MPGFVRYIGGAAANAGLKSSRAIENILQDRVGSIIISILLGLGLAIIFFRRVCKGDECVIIKSPEKSSEIKDRYYKIEGDCYHYTPYAVECPEDKKEEEEKEGV